MHIVAQLIHLFIIFIFFLIIRKSHVNTGFKTGNIS